MNRIVAHRGPDDEGFLALIDGTPTAFFGHDTPRSVRKHCGAATVELGPSSAMQISQLALGHRRLAIVDLSHLGHQPMCYLGHLWITYNGEIYNFPELKVELETLGYRFSSHSDTEVILAAYDAWGADCLRRFNGMWAFAIYDARTRCIFLARDRFGVKPLYYWISPTGMLAFGSEIKQFTILPEWRAVVNGQRAYDFLVWGLTDHTDETLFKGVRQIPGGCCASINLDSWCGPSSSTRRLEVDRWYSLTPKPFGGSFEAAASGLRELLTDSVSLRLRSDVPVGSCLSGGLDSSSIVCLLHAIRSERNIDAAQLTFSARSESKAIDEGRWINEVIGKTGLTSNSVYPSVDALFDESLDVLWHQDEPYGSTSIHAQWNVFRLAASEHVRVMLDGQGADELLGGYFSFFGAYLAETLRRPSVSGFLSEFQAVRRMHAMSLRSLVIATCHHLLRPSLMRAVARLLGRSPFAPAWLDLQRLRAVPEDPFAAGGARGPSVRDLSLSQVRSTNLPMLLHWEDRSSMAHSVEARVPFLDYRVAEYVLGLPSDYKISAAVTKRVLREAMRGVLPEAIRNRTDKIGFATAEELWLRERASQKFLSGIDRTIAVTGGIVREPIRELTRDMIDGKTAFGFLVWRIISFGDWVERFSVSMDE